MKSEMLVRLEKIERMLRRVDRGLECLREYDLLKVERELEGLKDDLKLEKSVMLECLSVVD
jgi:hypothetical protein